ncbi:MAG: carboxypeptidase-like regulatory domain-containing protein [Ekhidna sp.]|uniref:TonB-dependent receptor n=1 Tax=Ekhidna sp. TaxID=2608089 RepID=UPI0032EFF3B7
MKYFLFAFLIVSINAFGQQGIIRGTVIEDSNGEPLFGVTVQIKGTTNGAITDFDGKFEIKTSPGTYDLQASFVSFQTITISGLIVEANEVTLIDQINLKEDVALLDEVVVTAEVVKTTEAALLTVKRKSANLIDGISAASFRKIGDSDAASAAKRITGVSIEGGKYVYVRGLGDRYTKTLLNGMDIPGLDPDRNSLQMDIFPTNVLDNVIVSKTFTANLPADFTGGLVNIETKDVPDVKSMTASFGFGYNPSMHFNSDYLTYEGGKTDWLGFDDGTRELHISDGELFQNVNNPTLLSPADQQVYSAQLRGFNPQMGALRERSFMDYNFGFSYGNQKPISLGTLGYSFAISYKNSTEYYDDAVYNTYLVRSDRDELSLADQRVGEFGVNNVLIGGLAGVALKRDNAKYKLNILRLQSGETKAGSFDLERTIEVGTDLIGVSNNLEYSQKSLTNFYLSGEHFLDTWKFEWGLSPTISKITDPDVRNTLYERLRDGNQQFTGEVEISAGNTNFPIRIWRELDEVNYAGKLDAIKNFVAFENDAKISFGVGSTYKERNFIIRGFDWNIQQQDFTGNYNEITDEENLFPNEEGNFYIAQFIGGNVNQYDATSSIYSFYVSTELSPVNKLKAILGIRGEDYTQRYTGINQRNIELNNEKVVDEFNLFPTGNFIYSLKENQNLRLAYTRTIARYSFKEASFIEYFDPLTDRTFLGALSPIINQGDTLWDGNIRSTLIDNFDLRWEVFGKRGETLSVSAFYKTMSDPIEIVQLRSAASSKTFQPQNVGDATVYGTEIEFKKSLNFISQSLENFFINGNTTLSVSEITMTRQEFEARQAVARPGQEIDNRRELQGQSPYIINAGLSYDNFEKGLEVGLYYNVQGKTLTYTGGVNGFADVYSVPFNSLNFSAIKSFGQDDNMRLTLKVDNVLNDKREWEYESLGLPNETFEARSPGTRVSLGFRYEF